MKRAVVIAVALVTLVALVGSARAGSTWETLANETRRRCDALLEQSASLVGAHQATAAASAARRAASLCAADEAVLQSAGERLLETRQWEDARRALERARVLADAEPLPRERELTLAFHLGFAREVTGDLEGAIAEHRRLEAMGGLPGPNQYLVHYDLGDELMAVGRLEDAIDAYRRATALAPGRPVVRLALAVALDRDGLVDQSRSEAAAALALDPELHTLVGDDYVFVPAADVHYYRAVALVERGDLAEARLALRAFVAALPDGPYSAHARDRLAVLERRVDPRELDVVAGNVDTRAVARALGPHVPALEACLPPERIVHVRFQVSAAGLRPDPHQPGGECLIRALSPIDTSDFTGARSGAVVVPLAGRRSAASIQ